MGLSTSMGGRMRMVAAVIALLLPSAFCFGDPKAESKADSCRKFVQQFYRSYAAKCKKGYSAEQAVKAHPRSFSPAIIRALRENDAESKKHPGEIVGLDFDPILNAQDVAQRYEAGKPVVRGERYLVPVYGVWNGRKTALPDVTCELGSVNGAWRFEEFHYHRDKGKPDETFSQVMDSLRREWRKETGHTKHEK